jgi:CO/xanthine dehydrogenase Mo-binding subunit
MVYGHEELDFAIVAVKPANKVAHTALEQSAMGPAAAEPVEPGRTGRSGVFALEAAMDELAVALNIDPVELRLRNEPEQDEFKKLPFSSRSTRECYRVAAERFSWSRRNPEPRSMRDGRWATISHPVPERELEANVTQTSN